MKFVIYFVFFCILIYILYILYNKKHGKKSKDKEKTRKKQLKEYKQLLLENLNSPNPKKYHVVSPTGLSYEPSNTMLGIESAIKQLENYPDCKLVSS